MVPTLDTCYGHLCLLNIHLQDERRLKCNSSYPRLLCPLPPITVVEELEDELCLLGGTSDHVCSYVVSRSTAALIGVHESVSQTTSCQLFPGPLWALAP